MPSTQTMASLPDPLIPYQSILRCSPSPADNSSVVTVTKENDSSNSSSSNQNIIKLEGPNAEIVLDYGRCEAGIPVFEILSASSSSSDQGEDKQGEEEVSFRVIYSETREGIDHDTGDGPYFLFSSAMSSYRSIIHRVPVFSSSSSSSSPKILQSRHVQGSQRYQRLVLLSSSSSSSGSSITFRRIGFTTPNPLTTNSSIPEVEKTNQFSCSSSSSSSSLINQIHETACRTVELCTLPRGSVVPAWDIVDSEGTRVHGGHWAPLRQGTRWGDYKVRFSVSVESGGASWGVWMVANGVVFCLDLPCEGRGCGEPRKEEEGKEKSKKARVEVFEGLADKGGVFPPRRVVEKGWDLPDEVEAKVSRRGWVQVEVRTRREGGKVALWIEGQKIGELEGLEVRPLLGGSGTNTGSVALGGPEGWEAVYRDLEVISLSEEEKEGEILYRNSMGKKEEKRTWMDFQVGTNELACTVDGAKRDRACFGGDLYVMGQAVAYSSGFLEAIQGSIRLLTSHQTADGYLGNLCPIQAPAHDDQGGEEQPPTYAFYSMTYALLLTVAIKDYWLHSGDDKLVGEVIGRLEKLMKFVGGFVGEKGLVEAPIPLSMHWFPMGGPIFGASAPINLSYLDALRSMAIMTKQDTSKASHYLSLAETLKSNILTHLYDPSTSITRLSTASPASGIAQDVNAYAVTLGLVPSSSPSILSLLSAPSSPELPQAFTSFPSGSSWGKFHVVSPYATGFAVEALFNLGEGTKAMELMERVWGPMTLRDDNENYSGANWEAMTPEGKPLMHDCSLAHGWSAWPAFLLPKYLAGLRPLEAGWKVFGVEPVLVENQKEKRAVEAKIKTPGGGGVVRVKVDVDVGVGKGEVEVEVPEGKEGRFKAPKGWVVVDGDVVLKGPRVGVVKIERGV